MTENESDREMASTSTMEESPGRQVLRRFARDKMAIAGACGIGFIMLVALYAPFIANGRPLLYWSVEGIQFPFLRYVFAPDSSEAMIEKLFNYTMILLSLGGIVYFLPFLKRRIKWFSILGLAVILSIPFLSIGFKLDKTNWRECEKKMKPGEFMVFALVPYGFSENVSPPYQKSSRKHWLGTDHNGRDVLSRMVYGARVSLAVGILATGIAISIGVLIGLISGYFAGATDIAIMRVVEIIICFPTFLLLLILMAVMMDYQFRQSILLVIAVIGFTGWTGLCRLVRGEVLKLRSLPYIQSCVSLGIPAWRIMLHHLLPNVLGVVLVSFTFSVAGAILAESGLSFLGFGVQPPTASWGELLRQAFSDPFTYWHLTLWPGLALFVTVTSFNFSGEGLRKVFDPRA